MPIRQVLQETSCGCAVASVAMVTGVDFKKAARAVKGRSNPDWSKASSVGFAATWQEMLNGIRKLGFSCRMRKSYHEKEHVSILMFAWPWAHDIFHTIVWDPEQQRFFDPSGETDKPWDYIKWWYISGAESLVVLGPKKGK